MDVMTSDDEEPCEAPPVTRKGSRPQRIKRKHLLGKTFLKIYHIFCRLVCVMTVITQNALIDYYFVEYSGALWALWVIADVGIVALFVGMFFVSYRHLKRRQVMTMPAQLGELPLTYMTWFVYSTVLSAKICVLYLDPIDVNSTSVALQLREVNFFGPNMLRTAISLASVVLYLIIITSHDTKSRSPQSEFIMAIIGSAYLDLLDTSQFTDVLRQDRGAVIGNHLEYPTLGVICFNFFLPTIALAVLSKKNFGKIQVDGRYQMLIKVGYFVLANAPIFVIRLLIWHIEDQNISVFLIKNIIAIGLAVKDIHEFSQEVGEVVRDEFHLPSYQFRDFYPEPASTFNTRQLLEVAGESESVKENDAAGENEKAPD